MLKKLRQRQSQLAKAEVVLYAPLGAVSWGKIGGTWVLLAAGEIRKYRTQKEVEKQALRAYHRLHPRAWQVETCGLPSGVRRLKDPEGENAIQWYTVTKTFGS